MDRWNREEALDAPGLRGVKCGVLVGGWEDSTILPD